MNSHSLRDGHKILYCACLRSIVLKRKKKNNNNKIKSVHKVNLILHLELGCSYALLSFSLFLFMF